MTDKKLRHLRDVLDFLNFIERDGYGGMASFEIARMNIQNEIDALAQDMNIEYVPNTRIPIRCESCGKRRVRCDDINRIACSCPSCAWLILRFRPFSCNRGPGNPCGTPDKNGWTCCGGQANDPV